LCCVLQLNLESAVRLLEKLVRACAVSGQAWRAGYCSFHLVEVAEILQNQGLVAMGCCQCAYTCFEFGWLGMGQMYAARARYGRLLAHHVMCLCCEWSDTHSRPLVSCPHRYLMKTETIADALRAQINYQDALLHCFAGEWTESVACLRVAKAIFKRAAEHKKWRECTFAECFSLFFLGQFEESINSLTELLESTASDGDAYYECNALYWKSLNLLCTEGTSVLQACTHHRIIASTLLTHV
jgi:hypothetical protein